MKRYLVALFLFGLSVSGFAHAQCAAFPCVVATVSLTNQSHTIPNTPIFTPPASGIFRINAYLSVAKSHNTLANWDLLLTWTDDNGVMKATTQAWQHIPNAANATFVVQDVGGQPLFYKTRSEDGASHGLTYNLFIVVEQLQ
jgi:hypothetical protein